MPLNIPAEKNCDYVSFQSAESRFESQLQILDTSQIETDLINANFWVGENKQKFSNYF